jgi:hypothetical protein
VSYVLAGPHRADPNAADPKLAHRHDRARSVLIAHVGRLSGPRASGRGIGQFVPIQAWSSPVVAARHCSTMLGGDAPAADRDAQVFRPRLDTAAGLRLAAVRPGRRGYRLASPAGMLDEQRELVAKRGAAFLAQMNLGAADPEPDRLIRWPHKDRLPVRRLSSVPFPPSRLRSTVRTVQDQLSCRGDPSATSSVA